MNFITIPIDPFVIRFYQQVADRYGVTLEQVLSDALFKLAGELSLEAIYACENRHIPPS